MAVDIEDATAAAQRREDSQEPPCQSRDDESGKGSKPERRPLPGMQEAVGGDTEKKGAGISHDDAQKDQP